MSGPDPEPGARGSEPLAPNASIDDILARVEHLSNTSGSGAEGPPNDQPASIATETAAEPAPVADGLAAGTVPPPRPARPRGRLLATAGGILAVLIGIGAKVLVGVAVVGVGGQVLSSVFGGPFDRLPQATRDGFEQRLNTAIGPDASRLSETEYADRYTALVADGESRLGDPPLIAEVTYLTKMYDKADVATCATAARSEFSSTGSSFELNDKMWETLTQAELTNHIETQIAAIEAGAAKAPAQRTVSSDQADAAISRIFNVLTTEQKAILSDLTDSKARTDEEACATARVFHDAEAALAPADLALVARYIASP
jgi:Spy/CpxP family protein refolding chaperone